MILLDCPLVELKGANGTAQKYNYRSEGLGQEEKAVILQLGSVSLCLKLENQYVGSFPPVRGHRALIYL